MPSFISIHGMKIKCRKFTFELTLFIYFLLSLEKWLKLVNFEDHNECKSSVKFENQVQTMTIVLAPM